MNEANPSARRASDGGHGSPEILLDPDEAAAYKERRRRRLHVISIPALRLFGLNMLAVTALLHNILVLDAVSTAAFLRYVGFIEVYCVASWVLLYLFHDRVRLDLGLLFLIADYVPLVLTVYISGGERSWIYFLLLARVADQAATTFKRELFFTHVAVGSFLLLIGYLDLVEGRDIAWGIEAAKAGIMYLFALYVSFTARTAERQRSRTRAAIHVARDALKDLNATSGELREQRERLAGALAEAEHASEAKSEFLSRVSHELRTPMNAILGFAQLLELGELDEHQRTEVAEILKSGRHLLKIINDVLDIGRIESGTLAHELEPVDLSQVLKRVLDESRDAAVQRKLALTAHPPEPCRTTVLADPERFTEAIRQIVDNAIRYNRSPGSVTIVCTETAEDRIRIEVRDTGPGIEPDRVQDLFVPFDRLGREPTAQEGVGLGLALSQAYITGMGGEIGVESELDVGSTFWIELPVSPEPAGRAGAPARGAAAAAGDGADHTILYVRPDGESALVMERILAQRGDVRLLAIEEARAGLGVAREHRPDLVLLQTDLPDASGIDVLRRFKEDARTREIPVIAVSHEQLPGQSLRLMNAGARAHLVEPIEVHGFLHLLDRVLEEG